MDKRIYRIGIVEDDQFLGTAMAWQLSQDERFKVSWFCTGEELLSKPNFKPDLLVLDYHLDGVESNAMNGKEIVEKFNNTPVIMMSAQDNMDLALELLQSGIHDYVIKDNDTFDKVGKSINDIIDTLRTSERIEALDKLKRKDLSRMAFLLGGITLLIMASFLFS